ncbi:2'-5' RNA ligase [Sphaeroforma arctica JP610]|uniref:2'-5' RNA ligase n=1 Tax=Sphaeroforma arctica JP610 TaxID=667725 RepID=A0A0L0G4Q0_9EUKA|nr:2'-5' RNA ligase [Sphaeroforma arctica JP610]KNC83218.1 2'-5' RNA ligase [Sphaeroforma arctica JP610]|eukprot:XP_014157120.1 2'-5' RNA ligase [Sphaeroforma arctica JP610]
MRRWFVALVPPSDIQDKASAIIDELTVKYGTRTARTMPHVTLIAPFEVIADEGEATQPVKQVLRQVARASKPFTVSLAGFNSFAPRVLFIDVDKSACLSELKQHLERALAEACAITPDNRHYQPHMTIASRKVRKNNFTRIWQDLDNRTFEEVWQCTEVSLLVYEDMRWKVDMTFPIG